jgi:hypothetical protein
VSRALSVAELRVLVARNIDTLVLWRLEQGATLREIAVRAFPRIANPRDAESKLRAARREGPRHPGKHDPRIPTDEVLAAVARALEVDVHAFFLPRSRLREYMRARNARPPTGSDEP